MGNYYADLIRELNKMADRIHEHIEAGGGILDEDDHDDMMQVIEDASEEAQFNLDDEFITALQRARDAMRRWNAEEYPYLEDISPTCTRRASTTGTTSTTRTDNASGNPLRRVAQRIPRLANAQSHRRKGKNS